MPDNNKEDSAYSLLTRFCKSHGLRCRFESVTGDNASYSLCLVDTDGWTVAISSEDQSTYWAVIQSKSALSKEDLCMKYLKRAFGARYQLFKQLTTTANKFPDSIDELKLELVIRGY